MTWKQLFEKRKTGKFAVDEQTGKVFELETENSLDIIAAAVSIIYLTAALMFFAWQLIDIGTDRMCLLRNILDKNADKLVSEMCRIISFAVIGGGLGAVVNGYRSILMWHSERRSFGWRHFWKYLTLPLLGAVLAAMVYTLTRAGIGVIGGISAPGGDTTVEAFSAFAIGALSGYGAQKVFKWLDEQVNRIFKISKIAEIEVPNLIGKTEQEAKDILRISELSLGIITEQPTIDPNEIDKIVAQIPAASSKKSKASEVSITIARKK